MNVVRCQSPSIDVVQDVGKTSKQSVFIVEGIFTKEDIKSRGQQVASCFPVGVAHGELVEVGEERLNEVVVGRGGGWCDGLWNPLSVGKIGIE